MIPVNITEDSNHSSVDRLAGFSFRESGGINAVVVTLRKLSVAGQVLAEVSLAASESATLFISPQFVNSEGGVYVQTTGTGTLTGVLYAVG